MGNLPCVTNIAGPRAAYGAPCTFSISTISFKILLNIPDPSIRFDQPPLERQDAGNPPKTLELFAPSPEVGLFRPV